MKNTMTTAIAETTATHPAVLWLKNDFLPSIGGGINEAERVLGISEKVLRSLMRGTYEGNTARQLAKLEEQRQRITTQASAAMQGNTRYIPTEIMRRAWTAFDCAKAAGLINMVVGVSQIGKTTAAHAYKERYPDTTVLLELMPKPSISTIIKELVAALKLPGSSCRTQPDALHSIRAALSPRHLIIVDEAHLALDRQKGADALDIVRRLHDLTGCGVVLMMTDLDGSKLTNSPCAGQLDQLRRRGLSELLPSEPNADDVAMIWQAYNLPQPTPEISRTVQELARRNCFGTLLAIIRLAVAEARRDAAALDLCHFSAALRRMGRGVA